jgi:hypothetical protein
MNIFRVKAQLLAEIPQTEKRRGVVRFLAWARDFSLLRSVRTGSGANPPSYPMGAEGRSLGVKLEREADHPPPPIPEAVNLTGILHSLYAFMA